MRKPDPDGWRGIDLGLDYTRPVVCGSCRKVTIVMHNSGPVRCAHCGAMPAGTLRACPNDARGDPRGDGSGIAG